MNSQNKSEYDYIPGENNIKFNEQNDYLADEMLFLKDQIPNFFSNLFTVLNADWNHTNLSI